MVMKLIDYINLAKVTANSNLSQNEAVCNWALGLVGESEEFLNSLYYGTEDELISELGDQLWYACMLWKDLDLDTDKLEISFKKLHEISRDMSDKAKSLNTEQPNLFEAFENVKLACRIAEKVKKLVFHKKDVKGFITEFLGEFILTLASIRNIEEVAQKNIEKLKARYPEGFKTA